MVQSESPSRPSRLLWAAGRRPRRWHPGRADLRRHRGAGAAVEHRHRAHDPRPRARGDPRHRPGEPRPRRRPPRRPRAQGTIARLQVIGARRLPALGWVLAAWALLVGLLRHRCRAPTGAARGRARACCGRPWWRWLTAALAPTAAVEYLLLALMCPALGALTDSSVAWPRALLVAGDRVRGCDRGRRARRQPAADALAARSRPRNRGSLPRHRQRPQVGAGGARAGGRGGRALYPVPARTAGMGRRWRSRGRRSPAWRAPPGSAPASAGWSIVCVSFALAVALLLAGGPGTAAGRDRGREPDRGPARAGRASTCSAPTAAATTTAASSTPTRPASSREVIVRRYEAAWGELRHAAMPLRRPRRSPAWRPRCVCARASSDR